MREPIHDVDVLILLATALAAKRRPAELAEVVAAIDLIQGNIPSEEKMGEAFSRLGKKGLLEGTSGGLALTAKAEGLVEILPRKGEMAERLHELRGLMGAHVPAEEGAPVLVGTEELRGAIQAHRAAGQGAGKNLLVPKPKPEAGQQRPGQRRRKPMAGQKPRR